MKKTLLIVLGILGTAVMSQGQGIPFAVNPPAPNAQMTVCSAPATGNPCTNRVNIYGDAGLTQLIPQPALIGPTGSYTFFFNSSSAPIQVQITGRQDQIVTGGGGGGGGGALTVPSLDTAAMLGMYLFADGSTTQFKDSSAASNTVNFNGGGCTVAPTPLGTPGFGYTFDGSTQCGSFSAALNPAKTIMLALKINSTDVTVGGAYAWIGSTASNFTGMYFKDDIGGGGNRENVLMAVNTAGGSLGNEDSSNATLDGTFIVTFTCDTNDHLYFSANLQTVEPWYFNQGNGCLVQGSAGGQVYDLGGGPWVPTWSKFTAYAMVFWSTVKTKAQITANATLLEEYLRTARGVVMNTGSTQTASAAVDCIGDSLTVGSGVTSFCGIGTGNIMTLPANQGTWTTFNRGQNGATATGCNTTFPFDIQSNIPATASPRVHHIWLGTNDIVTGGLGLTAAQAWTQYQQCALSVKRIDPGSLVAIGTVVSRTALVDATRDSFNNLIRAGYQGVADIMSDFAEDPLLGADGLAGVSNCFQGDAIHPNQACQYNDLAPMAQRGIASKLGCLNFTCATTYAAGAPAATAVTATSEATNTMTFTTTLNPPVGSSVVCAGITPAGYNSPYSGWYVLTTSGTNFTAYNNTTGLGAGSVFGTCSVPQEKDTDIYAILNNTGNHSLESCVGRTWPIVRKNINAGSVTIVPWSSGGTSELVNGAANYALTTNNSVTLWPTLISAAAAGCNWRTIP